MSDDFRPNYSRLPTSGTSSVDRILDQIKKMGRSFDSSWDPNKLAHKVGDKIRRYTVPLVNAQWTKHDFAGHSIRLISARSNSDPALAYYQGYSIAIDLSDKQDTGPTRILLSVGEKLKVERGFNYFYLYGFFDGEAIIEIELDPLSKIDGKQSVYVPDIVYTEQRYNFTDTLITRSVAPAAAAVIYDTGLINAVSPYDIYEIECFCLTSANDAGNYYTLQARSFDNLSTLWNYDLPCRVELSSISLKNCQLQTSGGRFRLVLNAAGLAGVRYSGNIRHRRVVQAR